MQYKKNSLSVTSNFSIKKCLELINNSGENTLLVVDKKKIVCQSLFMAISKFKTNKSR